MCYLFELALKVKAGSAEGSSCCKLEIREMDDGQLGVSLLCLTLKDATSLTELDPPEYQDYLLACLQLCQQALQSEAFDEVKRDLLHVPKYVCFKASSRVFDILYNTSDGAKIL